MESPELCQVFQSWVWLLSLPAGCRAGDVQDESLLRQEQSRFWSWQRSCCCISYLGWEDYLCSSFLYQDRLLDVAAMSFYLPCVLCWSTEKDFYTGPYSNLYHVWWLICPSLIAFQIKGIAFAFKEYRQALSKSRLRPYVSSNVCPGAGWYNQQESSWQPTLCSPYGSRFAFPLLWQARLNSALPQVHNTAVQSLSNLKELELPEKNKNKVLTVGHCIFKQRGFHSAVSGVKTKPSRTQPPTPQLLKTIRQSKTKPLKAQFCLSLALPNRELTILVSDKEGTRSCLLLHPLSLQVAGCVFELLICVPACLQHCTCQHSGDSCP